jgi:serine/threonine protein kinase/Flp pilus assembly protein TadD
VGFSIAALAPPLSEVTGISTAGRPHESRIMDQDELRADSIFLAAVEKATPGERCAFLDSACGADRELRERIDRRLAARSKLPVTTAELTPSERAGTAIGPYKLLEQIGEGGFGVVFLAEQTQPVRRKVALKVLKPGMDTRQVVARFEAERQALALMDHPNIARVFDGGETVTGRPYFVMELVKGIPITAFCDQRQLTLNHRLELFIHVCQAVQHAHHKGIIHRDLKPSNVLAALDDGSPMVKVIDFGIAKATGQQLTDKTLFTHVAQMIGTPLYMSPEQTALSGLDVDTRSDIYSLGALLYELLTGTTPFEKRLQNVDYNEIRRVICDEEPPRPSTRLSDSKDTLPSISARRHTEPAKLTKLVRGDLDWIVMKCLEKDRNRRYETANGLAMDLQRYLHDEPVLAGPPSAQYRLRKFARRNKLALTIAGTFAAALLLGVAVLSVSTVLISRSYAAERKAHQQAEANFQRTRAAVDEFFTTVSQSKLFDVPGLQPLRKELLESAVSYYRNLAAEAGEDLSVRAGLAAAHFRLAEAYFEVDQSNDSIREVNAGLDLVEQLLREHPADSDLFRRIAGFWKGTRRMSQTARPPDDRAAAERTLNRFLQVWERLAAENPGLPAFQSDLATAYGSVGVLLGAYSRRAESIQSYRKSIALWESLVRANPEEPEYKVALVQAYGAAAGELSRAGHVKNKEAESFFNRALESWEELAALYPTALRYRAALVNVLLLRGYYNQNLRQLDHAIADYSKAVELDPNNANAHFEIGDACARLGRWDQAQAAMEKAAELDPANQWYMFHATVLQLRAGDLAGYRRVCREMLKRFGDARQPEAAERTAKTCLLVPGAVADLAPVLRLADRAVTGTEKSSNYHFFVLAKVLAEYRAGRNAEAVKWVERLAPDAGGRDVDAAAFAVLAMAQHQLGRREQAFAALDKAEAIVAKKMGDPGAGRPFGRDWDDWLRCRMLLDEARKLLKQDSRAKNQESAKKPD